MTLVILAPIIAFLPAVLVGAAAGYWRGWRRLALPAATVVAATALLWQGPDALLARIGVTIPGARGWTPLLLLAATLVGIFLAERWLPRDRPDRRQRALGAVLGGLTVLALSTQLAWLFTGHGRLGLADGSLKLTVPATASTELRIERPDWLLLVAWPLAAVVFLLALQAVRGVTRRVRR